MFNLKFLLLFILLGIIGYLLADDTYIVKRGDTLGGIAHKQGSTVQNIKALNKLSNDRIRVGQRLIIRQTTFPNEIIYTVKSGDNLTHIAKRNNTTISQIIQWNKLKNNILRVNQKLIVGYGPSALYPTSIVTKSLPTDNYHIVKKGENLTTISQKHDINITDLIDNNKLTSFLIRPGQRLWLGSGNVTDTKYEENAFLNATKHTVKKGENLFRIALQYKIKVDELKKWNDLSNENIREGQVLYVSDTNKSDDSKLSFTETFKPSKAVMPVRSTRILSEFGKRSGNMHKGIDFAGSPGDPIFSVLPGTVVFSGIQKGYGNVIIIEHEQSMMTVYGHNEANIVRINDVVQAGQQIASIGNTGNTTAFHLHFEYRLKGNARNPRELLPMK